MSMKSFLNLIFAFFFFITTSSVIADEIKAEDARELIKTRSEEVISHVKLHRKSLKEDSSKLYSLVNKKMVPHIDFTRTSRWILGKHWRKASKEQRLQFSNEFKKLLIRTYSKALLKLSDEKINYPPVKGSVKKGKVSVKSEIILPDGRRFNVKYRMHHKDQDWKIYDISVDGVSLISTYRSTFSTEIGKVGLEGLLENLVKKNKGFNL